MIKSGMTVLYQNCTYRVHLIVDYKPIALALLNNGIYVPIQMLSKLNEF